MRFVSCLLLAVTLFGGENARVAAEPISVFVFASTSSKDVKGVYSEMTDTQKRAFIKTRAEAISRMLTARGEAPVAITDEAVLVIKTQVDRYAARAGNGKSSLGSEDMGLVLTRASNRAAVIRQAFAAENVPPVLGVYVALIESEYNECLESPMGAKGIFQFLPKTAEKFGLSPDEMCDLQKAAGAAARYFTSLRAEFGSDCVGSILALQSYNIGQNATRANFGDAALKGGLEARSKAFWATVTSPDAERHTRHFVTEGHHYVPLFFAAAIVGENPSAFGLTTAPLSSY